MFSFIFILALSYAVYKLYALFAVPHELKDVPAISLFRSLLSVAKREPFDVRYETIIKPVLAKRGVARVWNQGRWELMVCDPRHVKEILARVDKYPKRRPGDENLKKMLLRKTLGATNILFSDGPEWRHHRRIANPAFKTSWAPEMFASCTKTLIALIEQAQGEPLLVQDLFRRLTLDVLGKGLFSYDFQAIAGNDSAALKLYDDVMKAMFNPIYMIFPRLEDLPSRRFSQLQSQQFRDFLKKIVQERKASLDSDHNDLLSLMLKASIEDAQYSEEDVVSDLSVFFFAGHDTTANTLTTIFYFLAENPETQEKARQEINRVLDFERRTPTADELNQMLYVECILKESLRIVPTVPALRRYCLDGDELLGGVVVPKDTFVNMQMWGLHHDEQVFPEPRSFRPERFQDVHGQQSNQLMAFGGGSRLCIGKGFSLLEQRIVVALMLQKFHVRLGPEAQELGIKVSSAGLLHLLGVDLVFDPVSH